MDERPQSARGRRARTVRPAAADVLPRTAAEPVEPYRPPYRAAAVAALAVWLLYALTLSRTTWFWDTSEYITVAHILGIPHPPGNPLFVLLARAWELLLAPFGLSVAVRINLFSATMGALAHGCWFLVAHRILSFYSADRTFRIVGAATAVLVSATAFTVWNQSNVNEKVYTVSLFTIALLSWLAFRWRDNLGVGKDDNLILLMVFILALSVGNHLMAFLAAPALVLFILRIAPRTLLNWRLYAAAVPAIVLGLSVHLFLPIRSGLDPIINEAAPTCENVREAMVSVVTFGRTGCENLSAALSRQQYDKPSMLLNPVHYPQQLVPRDAGLLAAQVINYFQWFDWQWARSVSGVVSWYGPWRPLFTLLFVLLGLWGAWTHWLRDRTSWWYMAALFGVLSFGLLFYLNFKYGYSDPSVSRDMTEVRERDYFFIVSFSLWGVWSGIGIAALWQAFTERFALRGRRRPALLAAPVLALAFIPFTFNFSWASRHDDFTARDWAYNLLNSVEPYAVLFTNGDNDTFPLWYVQEVEGVRRDVTVIVMSYLNTAWYARQLRDLTTPCAPNVSPADDRTRIICQRAYDVAGGPAVYRERIIAADALPADAPREPGLRPPTRSILPLSDREIDEVAFTRPFLIEQAQAFGVGDIQTTLPAQSIMVPANIFMATILHNSLADRPIYYAMTTQAYEELNLRPFLIRHGLAHKLHNGPVTPDPDRGLIEMPAELQPLLGRYVDVPRTEELLTNVFVHRGGFPDTWTRWVDPATDQIPAYYGYTHLGLAQVYSMLGDTARALRHQERGEAFWHLGMMRWR
jgi:hypothetical protein